MNDNELKTIVSTFCVTIATDPAAAEILLRQALAATSLAFEVAPASSGAIERRAALPRVDTGAEEDAAAAGAAVGAQTLLLVDDEENILAALRRLLRRDGYRILTAASGREGLELLAGTEVDVIISDQRRPNMTGVEFLRQAKLVWPESVRVVLSGYTELQSIADAINEGAIYKFLTKPWEDEQLREHVKGAFRKKAATDENRRLQRELTAANVAQADVNAWLERLLAQKQTALERDEISLHVAQEILEHIPVPVIGVDAGGMITFANAAALDVFVEFAPMLGADARDVLPASLLAGNEPDDGTSVPFAHGGRVFAAVRRSMGAGSLSQGRIYMLMPAAS